MQLWHKRQQGLVVDPMTREDLPLVMDINHQTYPCPATQQYFFECLKHVAYGSCWPWVACHSGLLIAYSIWSLGGESYDDLRLQHLAVHPTWQQRGYGTALYQRFLEEFENRRFNMAELLVPERNFKSLVWVRKKEFAKKTPIPQARMIGTDVCFRRLRQSR